MGRHSTESLFIKAVGVAARPLTVVILLCSGAVLWGGVVLGSGSGAVLGSGRLGGAVLCSSRLGGAVLIVLITFYVVLYNYFAMYFETFSHNLFLYELASD